MITSFPDLQHKCDLINMSYGEPTLMPDYGRFIDLVNEVLLLNSFNCPLYRWSLYKFSIFLSTCTNISVVSCNLGGG